MYVGLAVAVLSLLVFCHHWWIAPSPPAPSELTGKDLDAIANAEHARKLIDNYNTLADGAMERTIKLYSTLVGTPLVPILGTILGYIFGVTRSGKR